MRRLLRCAVVCLSVLALVACEDAGSDGPATEPGGDTGTAAETADGEVTPADPALDEVPVDDPAPDEVPVDDPEVPLDDPEVPVDDPEVPVEDDPAVEAPLALADVWGVEALEDLNPDDDVVEVELTAAPLSTTILDVPVDLMAYNGSIPGPLLQAKVGDRVLVHFTNDLPQPTTIHWHGLRISAEMDGTPAVQAPVQPGETFVYDFVVPDAGSYWYHPHVMTNEQLELGLQGVLVVRDEHDPTYDLERYVVVDDILLDDSGIPPFMAFHMEAMHGRTGNLLMTNGAPETLLGEATQGEIERWRIVNTANARTMQLSIGGASWRVVGTDGGLLQEPFTTDRLVLPVGARYDVEVSYDGPGPVQLLSWVLTLDENDQIIEVPIAVVEVTVAATEATPPTIDWPALPPMPERDVDDEVQIELYAFNIAGVGLQWAINGQIHPEDPIFTFETGATIRMNIVNKNGPEHPFHLHGQFFRILGRNGKLTADEPGLRDTVLVPGMEVVHIEAYMDNPGMWMAHCHILEHAELGMMSKIQVGP